MCLLAYGCIARVMVQLRAEHLLVMCSCFSRESFEAVILGINHTMRCLLNQSCESLGG